MYLHIYLMQYSFQEHVISMEPAIYWIVFYGSRVALFFMILHRRRALRAGRVVRFLLITILLFTFVWIRWIEPKQVAIRRIDLDL